MHTRMKCDAEINVDSGASAIACMQLPSAMCDVVGAELREQSISSALELQPQ